jgi:hypothetical protein
VTDLAIIMAGFGVFLIVIASLLSGSARRRRQAVRRLGDEVEQVTDLLRSPSEKAARKRAFDRIEAQKRVLHGLFDSGGW